MDNRPMTVQMKPKGRRKVVVATDLVTGAMNGFNNVAVDNFNLGNIVKTIGDLAKGTGLPVISQIGGGISNAIATKQATKAVSAANSLGTLSDYENKLIRVARDKVYLVTNGVANYVNKLPLSDGRGWESVIEVPSMPVSPTPFTLQGSLAGTPLPATSTVKTVAITPMISPLPISVPKAPGDANIAAAVQSSQTSQNTQAPQTLVQSIIDAASAIPANQQQSILQKAQTIFDSGTNGLLTSAQKALQNATTNLLPKTKALKDAEALLTAPQFGGNTAAPSSTISFSNPWVIGGIVGVVVLLVITVIAMRK